MKNLKKDLTKLRKEIDSIDIELLNILKKRLNVVKEIGILKREFGLPAFDKKRWNEVLKSRLSKGKKLNLNEKFVAKIFKEIHEESLRIESESHSGESDVKSDDSRI